MSFKSGEEMISKSKSCSLWENFTPGYIYFVFLLTTYCFPNILFAQTPTANQDMWVTDGTVYSIVVDDEYTYIGGSFNTVGPNTGNGCKMTSSDDFPNLSFPKVYQGISVSVTAAGI